MSERDILERLTSADRSRQTPASLYNDAAIEINQSRAELARVKAELEQARELNGRLAGAAQAALKEIGALAWVMKANGNINHVSIAIAEQLRTALAELQQPPPSATDSENEPLTRTERNRLLAEMNK
jgi:hypothetical protein